MNITILHTKVQQFITENLKTDLTKLILKGSPFPDVSIQELANQITAKKKSEYKLPTWFKCKNIYYPPKLSIEQTSSEITANYKATIISGESLIDITGGFGVDAFAFSKQFKNIIHSEINEELSKIVTYNYEQLGVENVKTVAKNGIDFLQKTPEKFDCIYIDPSRRNDVKGKVFLLKDCLPNVPENLTLLLKKSNQILIKNSPILDITSAVNELQFVKEIHIIALNNEVKELLFLLEKNYTKKHQIKTINYTAKKIQLFDFKKNTEITSSYSLIKKYLYEPNASILKSGGFHQISHQLKIDKLHQHSHLYTSDVLIDFPGRRFKIIHNLSYDKKQLKKLIPTKKANITTRNFPETVAQIRKKTGIKDGGNQYLFFTTDLNEKHIVLICEKV